MNSKTDLAIDVQNLCKSFGGKMAIDNVSIAQPRGSVWGFLGPNGSGKTTTIRMICGLLAADSGTGTCLGYDVLKQSRQIKDRTGYMTQKFSFWEDLTIRENLNFVARLYNLPNRRQTVDKTLENLDLTHRQKELAGGLSGGWKQRLALAAVTMHQPSLLLLDEPTAGVDPQARMDFWTEIHRLSQAEKMTVLVSTHYMDEAERCDHIVYLAHGKMITQGTVEAVIAQSKLSAVYGIGGRELREKLSEFTRLAGVESATYYGGALHLTTLDNAQLQRDLAKNNQQRQTAGLPVIAWATERPSLDAAFIALEKQSGGDKR